MATTIPPHNLGEVIDACLHLVERPDATVDDLMRFVPAPDLPGGARIVDGPGIREAYVSGRGGITVEAIATTETRAGNLPRIIVTEIPYQVNKASLLERIAGLVAERRLDDIRDLRDESSRDGMRIVIECKRGVDPAAVLTQLYRLTDLRTTINVNMVALVGGAPRTLGLREALVAYLAHQRDVLTRRTTHRLERARARAHVVEGLLTAIDQLDAVIATIRAADSAAEARGDLMEGFDLSEIQAQAVLDLQLRRLAALERAQLEDEYQELVERIAGLERILGDTGILDGLLVEELTALRRRFANDRRTRLEAARTTEGGDESVESTPTFEAQEVTVAVTRGGVVRSVARRRTSPALTSASDPAVAVLRATTEDTLLLVDAGGTAHRIAVADVPVVRPSARGMHVGGLLGGGPDRPIVGAVLVPADIDDVTLVTVSANGLVKRSALAEIAGSRQRSIAAAGLKPGDELVGVTLCRDGDELVMAHDGGLGIRFSADDARPMGRTAAGVAGLRTDGARVVSVGVLRPGETGTLLSVSSSGIVRRFAADEIAVTGRGGKGVKVGDVPLAWFGPRMDLHLTAGGEARLVRGADIATGRRTGKGTALGGTVMGAVAAEAVPEGDG
jgi:DNA gyrase subunit A